MAKLTITHLQKGGSQADIRLGDFYVDLTVAGSPRVIDNVAPSDIPRFKGLQKLMADAEVSLAVTYTADEVASGLMSPPSAIEADDVLPVAAATKMSAGILLRVPMAAGAGGNPDDLTVIAAGALTKNYRVLDVWAEITGNVAGETVQLRDQAAGAGVLLADVDANAALLRVGPNTAYGGVTAGIGATKGLFVHRTDDAIAGTLYALIRPEVV